jgi:Zn-dependent protease
MSLPRRAANAVAESPLSERVADAQRFVYAPLLEWARRSPLHSDVLGHSLHPVLTDLTLGCWTSATLLDVVGGPASRHAATLLTSAGVAVAIPTAVAGAADWAEMTASQRRVGAVHALGTDIATLLFMASLIARLRGRYAAATRLGAAANLVMIGAGFLGGHLALNQGAARRDR